MLALALGSCDGGDELDSDEPKSSAHSKPHTPSTAQPMSLQDADVLAPGRGLRVIGRTRGKVGPHAYTGVGAITPDGQLVVDVFERNVSEPLNLNQSQVALRDPSSGDLRYISRGLRRKQDNQVGGTDATKRWVTWVETPSTSLGVDPWVLYSHNRDSGQDHRLGTAPKIGKRAVSPRVAGDSQPTIVGDRVYIAAVSHLDNGKPVPAVYSAALDGTGRLRKEYNGEIVPQATSHGVFTIDATQGPWRIRAHDIGSGKSRTITKAAHNKETIDDLVAAGDKMAWITRGNGSSQLYVKTGSEEPRLLVRTKKELYYPIITNRYVGFETPNETAYIYDFDARALYRLTRRQAPMAAGYGNYVAWTDRSKKQTVVAKLTSS